MVSSISNKNIPPLTKIYYIFPFPPKPKVDIDPLRTGAKTMAYGSKNALAFLEDEQPDFEWHFAYHLFKGICLIINNSGKSMNPPKSIW